MIEIVGRIEGEVKLRDEKTERSVNISKERLIKEISEIEKLVRHPDDKMELEILKAWIFSIYGIRLQKHDGIIELYPTQVQFWGRKTNIFMKDNIKVYNLLCQIVKDKQKNGNRIKKESI